MPTPQDIEQQQQLLANNRTHLKQLLRRAAQHDNTYSNSSEITNNIAAIQDEIAHIKALLRSWGVEVEHPPTDETWLTDDLLHQRAALIASKANHHNHQVFISDMRRRFIEHLENAPIMLLLRFAEHNNASERPAQQLHPYNLVHRRPDQPDELLPAEMRLLDLYDQHNGQLLILGAPGAGKTFLLHELGYELAERAATNDSAPVPVIFSLATWQPDLSLQQWMINELSQRYGAKQQFLTQLFEFYLVLPLLDGLDELGTLERRQQCVAAINEYYTDQLLEPPLVVTCREREYQELPGLALNAALVVQPLTPTQVNGYLAEPTFASLRQTFEHNAVLADLARVPLMLSLMANTYREHALQLPDNADAETIRQIVVSDYVAHCCAPRADANALTVPVDKLRAFLAWLARGMIAHNNQQDFYIEFLQPSWLPSKQLRLTWRLVAGLVGDLIHERRTPIKQYGARFILQ
jgi:hypothetical protein